MHIDFTPCASNFSTAWRISSSTSGVSISPELSVRSVTPSLSSLGTNGLYGSTKMSYMEVRTSLMPRLISTMSRKFLVVIIPVFAPRPVSRALVARVVPWIRTSTPPRKSFRDWLNEKAAFSRELRTPTSGPLGVVGDLNSLSSPVSMSTKQSVNVPPTSMPILFIWNSLRRFGWFSRDAVLVLRRSLSWPGFSLGPILLHLPQGVQDLIHGPSVHPFDLPDVNVQDRILERIESKRAPRILKAHAPQSPQELLRVLHLPLDRFGGLPDDPGRGVAAGGEDAWLLPVF